MRNPMRESQHQNNELQGHGSLSRYAHVYTVLASILQSMVFFLKIKQELF